MSEIFEVVTYWSSEKRHLSLEDPQVKEEAKRAQEAVKIVKTRLSEAGLLKKTDCIWCEVDEVSEPEFLGNAKEAIRYFHLILMYHGFHCENLDHAEKFHTLVGLDDNMHFSCCNPELMNSSSLV